MIVNRKIAGLFKNPGFVNIDYLVKNKLETDPSKILNILNRDWRKWIKPLCMFDGGGLDPTFGYGTAGSSSAFKENVIIGSVFDCPESGTAQSITAYIHTGGKEGTEKVKFGIYLHSDLSFVGSTEEFAIGTTPFTGWKTLNFTTPPSSSATSYILVVWATVFSNFYIYYDAGNTNQGHYQSLTYGTFPDPLVPTHDDNKYSIYCTYTTAAPPKPKGTIAIHAKLAGII